MQLGLGVEDLDSFHADALNNGISFTSPPREVHGSRIARFLDPDGAEISIGGR